MTNTDTAEEVTEASLDRYEALAEECLEAFKAQKVSEGVDALFFLMLPDLQDEENLKRSIQLLSTWKQRYKDRRQHDLPHHEDGLFIYDSLFIPRLVVALPPTRRIISFAPVPKRQVNDENRNTYEIIAPWQYSGFRHICGREDDKGPHFYHQYISNSHIAFAWESPYDVREMSLEFIPNGGCEGRDRSLHHPHLASVAQFSSEFLDYGMNFDGGMEINDEHMIQDLAAINADGAKAIQRLRELEEEQRDHFKDDEWDEAAWIDELTHQKGILWKCGFEEWEKQSFESLRTNYPFKNTSSHFCPVPYGDPRTNRGIKLKPVEHAHNAVVNERLDAQGGML